MIVLKCMPHVQHAYFTSFDQLHSSFVALSLQSHIVNAGTL